MNATLSTTMHQAVGFLLFRTGFSSAESIFTVTRVSKRTAAKVIAPAEHWEHSIDPELASTLVELFMGEDATLYEVTDHSQIGANNAGYVLVHKGTRIYAIL